MPRRGICRTCWPDGWPADVTAVGCEHGSYVRGGKAAEAKESEDELEGSEGAAEDAAEEE